MNWTVVFAKHAQKNPQKLAASGLKANAQHRLVSQVLEDVHTVKVLRTW